MSSSSLSKLTPVNCIICVLPEGSAPSAAPALGPTATPGPAGWPAFTPEGLFDFRKRFPFRLRSSLDGDDSPKGRPAAPADGSTGCAAGAGEGIRSEAGFSTCPGGLRPRMRLSRSASRLRAAVWEPRRWGGGCCCCSSRLLLMNWLLLQLKASGSRAFFFKNLLPPPSPSSPARELWGLRCWSKN